jgi:hypothetical protein
VHAIEQLLALFNKTKQSAVDGPTSPVLFVQFDVDAD